MTSHSHAIWHCMWILIPSLALAQSRIAGDACEQRANKPPPIPLQAAYEKSLDSLKVCRKGAANAWDYSACNIFVGRALELLYQNRDFKAGADFLLANEIANRLRLDAVPGWQSLGAANDQNALNNAQLSANLKRPVVAVKPGGASPGHIALILPGSLEKAVAPKWFGFEVPNSASFFKDNARQSFIGCPLSEVWLAGPTDVSLYHKP